MIETGRLIMRPVKRGDAGAIFKVYKDDADYFKYTRIPHPYTRKDAEEFVNRKLEDKAGYWLVIVEKESDTLIGSIGIRSINEADQNCETGFSLGSKYANKGYMTEAAGAFFSHVFDKFGLHRIEIRCCVDNKASKKVIEKLGGVQEGRLRGSVKVQEGFSDEYVHSILCEEWK